MKKSPNVYILKVVLNFTVKLLLKDQQLKVCNLVLNCMIDLYKNKMTHKKQCVEDKCSLDGARDEEKASQVEER